MSNTNRVTINLEPEYLEKLDKLGVLLNIPPAAGRLGKREEAITNRSETIRRAIELAIAKVADIKLSQRMSGATD